MAMVSEVCKTGDEFMTNDAFMSDAKVFNLRVACSSRALASTALMLRTLHRFCIPVILLYIRT
jgi:hypothetical protein